MSKPLRSLQLPLKSVSAFVGFGKLVGSYGFGC